MGGQEDWEADRERNVSAQTSTGRALAATLRRPFLDADDFHSPEAVKQMAAGRPLTDADRRPWLLRLNARLRHAQPSVLACSALKRQYRQTLRGVSLDVLFVCLHPAEPVVRARLAARAGHFMPEELLTSQYATLELPEDGPEDGFLVLDTTDDPGPEHSARRVADLLAAAAARP